MSAPEWVNLNGALVPAAEARLGLFDHGLLYGDGLFETLRARGGRFFRLEAHLARLEEGARRLRLPLPWGRDALAEALRATLRASGSGDAVLRLTVTRGEGPPLPDPDRCGPPAFFVTLRPASPGGEDPFERGLSACLAGAHPRTWIPGIKSLSYLPFQQAREAARARGFDAALLAAGEEVVEASAANLFLVAEGVLLTPGLESGCLPGIARAAVLEAAAAAGLPCREGPVPARLLATCSEAFLTSSVSGVLPLTRVEDRTPGDGTPGPVTRLLRDRCEEMVRAESAP